MEIYKRFLFLLVMLGCLLIPLSVPGAEDIANGTDVAWDSLEKGKRFFQRGQYKEAETVLLETIINHPNFQGIVESRRLLTRLYFQDKDYEKALVHVSQIPREVVVNNQELLEITISSSLESGHYYHIINLAGDMVRLLPEEKQRRKQVLNRLIDIIHSQIPIVVLHRYYEDHQQETAFPMGIIHLKLAKYQCHIGDQAKCTEQLDSFKEKFSGHPFTGLATELLDQYGKSAKISTGLVGVILPLSGRFKPYGKKVLRGIQLALKSHSQKAKDSKKKEKDGGDSVRLLIEDNQGDEQLTVKLVRSLVKEKGVQMIIGPLLYPNSRRAALLAQELKTPLISFSRGEDVAQMGTYIFRNNLTNKEQGRFMARYAMGPLKMKKMAIMFPNHPYGVEVMNAFWSQVVQKGGEITAVEGYADGETTFYTSSQKLVGKYFKEVRRNYLDKVAECKKIEGGYRRRKCREQAAKQIEPQIDFEAVFIPDSYRQVASIAPSLVARGVEVSNCLKENRMVKRRYDDKEVQGVCLLGVSLWNFEKILERGEKYVRGAVFCDAFFKNSPRKEVKEFVSRFQEEYHLEPGLLEALAFDTMNLSRKLLNRKDIDREELRQKLSKVENFPGVTGLLSVDSQGNFNRELYLLTISRHGIEEIVEKEAEKGSDLEKK